MYHNLLFSLTNQLHTELQNVKGERAPLNYLSNVSQTFTGRCHLGYLLQIKFLDFI